MADKNSSLGKRRRSVSPSDVSSHRESKKRTPHQIKLSSTEIREMSRDRLVSKWKDQEVYIDHLLSKLDSSGANEVAKLKESEKQLQLQIQEYTRRENVLNMRLATKQQEMQELVSQVHDLKQAQNSEGSQLHQKLIDPAVNLVFNRMKSQLSDYKDKLEQAQSDLSAWKFTPDSVTGKKLMAKCRSLIQENQDLGKQISQGRVAQLEAEIALQKKFNKEVKASLDEIYEFVLQLDEEVEAMQSTVLNLEYQLKETKDSTAASAATSHVQQAAGSVKSTSTKESRTKSTSNGPIETGNSTSTSKLVSRSQDS